MFGLEKWLPLRLTVWDRTRLMRSLDGRSLLQLRVFASCFYR